MESGRKKVRKANGYFRDHEEGKCKHPPPKGMRSRYVCEVKLDFPIL